MHRRDFLIGGAGLAVSGAACSAGAPAIGRVHIGAVTRPVVIGTDAVGLSVETGAMRQPGYLDDRLVGFLRRLSPSGVLRLGGNSSEFGLWDARGAVTPPYQYPVTPAMVAAAARLCRAAGWRAIHGLNLAHGDPARAADEAAFVVQAFGPALLALQIGNEPDLYGRHVLGAYDLGRFLDDWGRYAAAIGARLPQAPLAGPDVAGDPRWLQAFVARYGGAVRFVSDHYYATGPASSPEVTIGTMLAEPNRRFEALARGVEPARQRGIAWRLTECNSCYGGGKPGVSDTLAAALWAVGLVHQVFAMDGRGVCFHGGPRGAYAPLPLDNGVVAPRPLFYGMLMVSQALPGRVASCVADLPAGCAAYAMRGLSGQATATLVNLSGVDLRLSLTEDGDAPGAAAMLRLTGAGLTATSGVTLGGAEVGVDGAWTPEWTVVPKVNAGVDVIVPAGSAAVVRLPATSASGR